MEQRAGVYGSLECIIATLRRCTDCHNGDYTSYHCPLCPVWQYKPRQLYKVKKHLEVHWKTAVKGRNGKEHNDFQLYIQYIYILIRLFLIITAFYLGI